MISEQGGEEFKKVCQTLKENFQYANVFAKSINARVNYSTSHDWPAIIISFKRQFDKKNRYFINKNIFLALDDYKNLSVYKVWVAISNSYGLKELFAFLPNLSKKRESWKRTRWVKDIGFLKIPIDRNHLMDLFKEAKRALDEINNEIAEAQDRQCGNNRNNSVE